MDVLGYFHFGKPSILIEASMELHPQLPNFKVPRYELPPKWSHLYGKTLLHHGFKGVVLYSGKGIVIAICISF